MPASHRKARSMRRHEMWSELHERAAKDFMYKLILTGKAYILHNTKANPEQQRISKTGVFLPAKQSDKAVDSNQIHYQGQSSLHTCNQ